MTCLICNELFYHHIITCVLISYVSHINIISPPKLSLNYQNQTRTFHPPTLLASAPPEPDVAAVTGGGERERSHIGVRAWALRAQIRHSTMLHVDLVALKIGCWRGRKKALFIISINIQVFFLLFEWMDWVFQQNYPIRSLMRLLGSDMIVHININIFLY